MKGVVHLFKSIQNYFESGGKRLLDLGPQLYAYNSHIYGQTKRTKRYGFFAHYVFVIATSTNFEKIKTIVTVKTFQGTTS